MSQNTQPRISKASTLASTSATNKLNGTAWVPSDYLQTMSLSTDEFLAQKTKVLAQQTVNIVEFLNIHDASHQTDFAVSVDQPLFQPNPALVHFQSYVPLTTYSVTVNFRNMDTVARRFTVLPSDSPYFTIVPPKHLTAKVAPSIEVPYVVKFTPDEAKDYRYELVCVTEREKFVVPIQCIGKRAVLDFPDEVRFGMTAVKLSSTKTLLIRNIGERAAKVSMSASKPFHLDQQQADLAPQACMQVVVKFLPTNVGSVEGALIVQHDTGEVVQVKLSGSAEDVNVRLERSTCRFEPTYLGKVAHRVMRIFNRSDVLVHFQWKPHSSVEEEESSRERYNGALEETEIAAEDEFNTLMQSDPTIMQHLSLLTRTFAQKKHELQWDPLLFSDDVFSIEPTSGDIWPNSEAEISVYFRARQSGEATCSVFCDVTGRESRLPLKLQGDALPPYITTSTHAISLSNVFLASYHEFQITLSNEGEIDADVRVGSVEGLYGASFEFSESAFHIPVGQTYLITGSFHASGLGQVHEEIRFIVADRPDPLVVAFHANVIGPTFHLTHNSIDFGVLPYGFLASRVTTLVNTSSIAMKFRVRISEKDVASEFDIQPSQAVVPPHADIPIQIDFLPANLRTYDVSLLIDVDGVGEELAEYSVIADCVVPDISVVTPVADFGRCFINYPYTKSIQLQNDSDLPGKYEMIAPVSEKMEISSDKPVGIISARSVVHVPITLKVFERSPVNFAVKFRILGSPDFPPQVAIGCIGEGAVVSVAPSQLDWPRVPVLVDTPKTVRLTNESLIPASYKMSIEPTNGVFSLDQTHGELASGQSVVATVHTRFVDNVSYSAKLRIEYGDDNPPQFIPLSAIAQGPSIVATPSMSVVAFGDQFSQRECRREFSLKNHGTRTQKISFVLDSPPPNSQGHCRVMRGAAFKKTKTPSCPNPPDPSRSVFGVWPERATLLAGQELQFELRGLCDGVQTIDERLICYGSLENSTKRDVLFEINASASFISPVLDLSESSIVFELIKQPESLLEAVSKRIIAKNVSALPLTVKLTTEYPFTSQPGDAPFTLAANESTEIAVKFFPDEVQDKISRQFNSTLVIAYNEHPQTDRLPLSATVSFANVAISASRIDFGCIPNATRKTLPITVSNTSPIPVDFTWCFIDSSLPNISQIFDILPLRGTLAPGDVLQTHFTFWGVADSDFSATALCMISDGPTYTCELSGRASNPKFSLESSVLAFGDLALEVPVSKRIPLKNHGLVDLEYKVLNAEDSSLTLEPTSGILKALSTTFITVHLCPLLPRSISEVVSIQVGLEVHTLEVSGQVVFPVVWIDLERKVEPAFEPLQALVKTNLPQHLFDDPIERCRELDRLVLVGFLERQRRSTMFTQPPTTTTRFGTPTKQSQPSSTLSAKLPSYALPLGTLTRNSGCKRSFHLKNISSLPVSVTLNKKLWGEGHGLTITPEKVTSLPAGESVEFHVTFSTRPGAKGPFPLGDFTHAVPFDINSNGPRVSIILSATVCEPELEISDNIIDFQSVDIGSCRLISTILTNRKQVPCDWSVVRIDKRMPMGLSRKAQAVEQRRRQMDACFECSSQGGRLLPGESVPLEIRFTPQDDSLCTAEIDLKIVNNSHKVGIKLSGLGVDYQLSFSQTVLELTPLVPYGPSVEASFHISNSSEKAIEVYVLELDESYAVEEQILTSLTEYDENDRLFLPPRIPGRGLPAELIQAYAKRTGRFDLPMIPSADGSVYQRMHSSPQATMHDSIPPPSRGRLGSAASVTIPEGLTLSESRPTSATTRQVPTAGDAASITVADFDEDRPVKAAIERYIGTSNDAKQRKLDRGGLNIIFHGRRMAGKSTLARMIGEAYHSVVISVDEIVEGAMRSNSELGRQARQQCIDNDRDEDEAVPASKTKAPAIASTGTTDNTSTSQSVAASNVTDSIEDFTALPRPSRLSEQLFYDIIAAFVSRPENTRGIIFEGLLSKYAEMATVLIAQLRALGTRKHVHFVLFDVDPATAQQRAKLVADQAIAKRRQDEDDELAKYSVKELAEDDYDALPDDQRAEYDRKLKVYKRFISDRQREIEERNRRRQAEEEERRQEEERLRQKKAKKQPPKVTESVAAPASHSKSSAAPRPTLSTSRPGSSLERDPAGAVSLMAALAAMGLSDALIEDVLSDKDQYDSSLELVCRIVDFWDTSKGDVGPGFMIMDQPEAPKTPVAQRKPNKGKETAPPVTVTQAETPLPLSQQKLSGLGVPRVMLNARGTIDGLLDALMKTPEFPTIREILMNIGDVDRQLIAPPPITLDIISKPVERTRVSANKCFYFADKEIPVLVMDPPSSGADLGSDMLDDEQSKLKLSSRKLPTSGEPIKSSLQPLASQSKKLMPGKPGPTSTARTPVKKGGKLEDEIEPVPTEEVETFIEPEEVRRTRWVVPAKGSVTCTIRFASNEVGMYDQTFTFETVSTFRQYSVYVRARCEFPHISSDPKVLFSSCLPSLAAHKTGVLQHTFLKDTQTYEFGPVLSGISREDYKGERHKKHIAKFNFHNPTPADLVVTAHFETDTTFLTFAMDPSTLLIPPNETRVLRVWAYPKTQAIYEDQLVVCVKDNPEPFCFGLRCEGVEPAIELEKKSFAFDRLLLHRKDTRSINVTNKSKTWVGWSIQGLEQLGDDFSAVASRGTIEPLGTTKISLSFRSTKAATIKKHLRLEISDIDGVTGVVQAENLSVIAEAYDVAVDLTFPKHGDGGFDFETLRVLEEKSLTCMLKNRGKYEITYKFAVDHDLLTRELPMLKDDAFLIAPLSGTLLPNDKAVSVKVIFRSRREINFKDLALIKCEVVEPHMSETIANIPIHVSARAVYTRYEVSPTSIVNFDSIIVGSGKQSREFYVENKGEFDFRFAISGVSHDKFGTDGPQQASTTSVTVPGNKAGNLPPAGGASGPTITTIAASALNSAKGRRQTLKPDRADKDKHDKPDNSSLAPGGSVAAGAGANRLPLASASSFRPPRGVTPNGRQLVPEPQAGTTSVGYMSGQRLFIGSFSVYPALGTVPVGSIQKITVEVDPVAIGKEEVHVILEVDHRSPEDHPKGHEIVVCTDNCSPGIVTKDFHSIFPECAIQTMRSPYYFKPSFVIEDGELNFGAVQIGQVKQVRVRLTNHTKVPCEVQLSQRQREKANPGVSKTRTVIVNEGFTFDPSYVLIPSHESRFAVISFSPASMLAYTSSFEANVTSGVDSNTNQLTFDVAGEGALPHVVMTKPTNRNSDGMYVLQFQRTLINTSKMSSITIKNNGSITATVNVELVPPGQRRPMSSRGATRPDSAKGAPANAKTASKQAQAAPKKGVSTATSRVVDEPSMDGEDLPDGADDKAFTIIEGTRVSIAPFASHSCHIRFDPKDPRPHMTQLKITVEDNEFESTSVQVIGEGYHDDVTIDGLPSLNNDLLEFGDTPLKTPKSIVFTMTNHSPSPVKYTWPSNLSHLTFAPQQGHLASHASQDVTASFEPSVPIACAANASVLTWSYVKIVYTDTPANSVGQEQTPQLVDWNSTQQSIKYVINEHADGHLVKERVVEPIPEPSFAPLEDSLRHVEMRYSAISEYPNFECNVANIPFRETMLYQTRMFSFTFKNKGAVRFNYSWSITVHDSEDRVDALSESHGDDSSGLARYPLFSIEPASGIIMAGETLSPIVRFCPSSVGKLSATLRCTIQGLAAATLPPTIELSGTSQRPYCHFDLPDSDYLTSGRRSGDGATIPAQLDPNTRVLEFESRGVNVRNEIRFLVFNPTNLDHVFRWICTSEHGIIQPTGVTAGPFTCVTPDGVIRAGKKVEMSFEYMPTSIDLAESLWSFNIASADIHVPFILVGHAQEPNITLDRTFLLLPPTLVGHRIKEVVRIMNREAFPLDFAFDKRQIANVNSAAASLTVTPQSGIVPANDSLSLEIEFSPNNPQPFDLNLPCLVSRKALPLILRMQTDAFVVSASVATSADAPAIHASGPTQKPTCPPINFGLVRLNDKSDRFVSLINDSMYPLEYKWVIDAADKRFPAMVEITPSAGLLAGYARVEAALLFCPTSTVDFKGAMLSCVISNGPTFNVPLMGAGSLPLIKFEPEKLNFGKAFIHRHGMPVERQTLLLTNNDSEELSIRCDHDKSDAWDIDISEFTIAPQTTVKLAVSFKPTTAQAYQHALTFLINGTNPRIIQATGTGVPLKLQLEKASQKVVALGSLQIGQTVKKTVQLINSSVLPVPFVIMSDVTSLRSRKISISPTGEVVLPAKGSVPITFTYSPTLRAVPFTEEIGLDYLGLSQPLLTLTGCCQGIKVELDHLEVQFGSVVVNNKVTRKVLLSNTGDIGTKFSWKLPSMQDIFEIKPSQGYIAPGSDLAVAITFAPRLAKGDIRVEDVRCELEGASALSLILAGTTTTQPLEKEVLQFVTNVRQTDTKAIKINNQSNEVWTLRPIFDNEYFTGAPKIVVPAGQSIPYEVTYAPMTMTLAAKDKKDKDKEREKERDKDDRKTVAAVAGAVLAGATAAVPTNPIDEKNHSGTVFIPCPDGTALYYSLIGQAMAPKPIQLPQREVPCKVWYTEQITVANWLKKPQRFHCSFKLKGSELSTIVKGLDYVDVAASSSVDYRVNFLAHKEGPTIVEVTFLNKITQEYLVYELGFRCTPAGVVDTVQLKTPVRQSICYTFLLDNPLPTPVTFVPSCNYIDGAKGLCAEVQLPSNIKIPAKTEGYEFAVEFFPLRVRNTIARLAFTSTSHDLGSLAYDLSLMALPAPQLPTERFKATLGDCVIKRLRFVNFCTVRTDYTVSIDCPDFSAQPNLNTPAAVSKVGSEYFFDVSFEPSRLGEVKATLTVSSIMGGDYSWPLYGECLQPKPTGPFVIKNGQRTSIPFKNVSLASETYAYVIDAPGFSVKASEVFKAKETRDIVVKYDGAKDEVRNAQLLVTSTDGLSWVFYLRGTP